MKENGWEAIRSRKGFFLFISNEDMDDIIKIVKLLEKSGLLTDGATETEKYKIKKMTDDLPATIAASLIAPTAFSLINAITERRVIRAGKGQEGGILPLVALSLMMKVLGKEVRRAGKGGNIIDQMDKNFKFLSIL